MKTTFKLTLVLLLALAMMIPFVACGEKTEDKDTTTAAGTTTEKVVTIPVDKTTAAITTKAPDVTTPSTGDDDDEDFSKLNYSPVDFAFNHFSDGDEKAAQTNLMGDMVYWYDQNWCGSTVAFSNLSLDGKTITCNFTHSGSCWYGAQLFYNPEGTENFDVYHVNFTITSSVDTEITVCGTVYALTAGEAKEIDYYRWVDMHPEDTNYQYGDSVFSLQFGTEDPEQDIVDGEYSLTFNSIEMAHYE